MVKRQLLRDVQKYIPNGLFLPAILNLILVDQDNRAKR